MASGGRALDLHYHIWRYQALNFVKTRSSVFLWLITFLYLTMLVNPAIVNIGRVFVYLLPFAITISLFQLRFFYGQVYAILIALLIIAYYFLVSLPYRPSYWADFAVLPLLVFSSVSLMRCYVYQGGGTVAFFRVMLYACLGWSAILFFERISPRFKDALGVVFERNVDAPVHLVELRSAGVHETGGDGLSLNLCLMLTVVVLYYLRDGSFSKIKLIFLTLFVMLAGSFAGRSGVFVFLGVLLVCLFLINFYYFVFSGIAVSFFVGFISSYFNLSDVYALALIHGWEDPLVRFLYLFFDSSGDNIFVTLFDRMLIFRDDPFDLLLGSGFMGREIFQAGVYIGESDLGIVRITGAVGVLGYLLIFMIYIIPFIDMVRKPETRDFSIIMFAIPLYVFAADFKLIYSLSLFPLFLLYALYGLERFSHVKVS